MEWLLSKRKGQFLGVNLGRPIVINGALLRSCAEVCAVIELSFGVESEVTQAFMH